jgi:bacteriocin-like protein
LGAAGEPVHSGVKSIEPVWPHHRWTLARMETTMNKKDTDKTRELTETELNQVVGGDTALQHEATHADLPNNGIQFGGGRTPVAIIAILIGM